MKVSQIMRDLDRLDVPASRCVLAESHGESVVASAINLLEFIARNFEPADARKLERKLTLAIESRDPGKLTRAIRRLRTPAKDELAEAVAQDADGGLLDNVAIELAMERALAEVEEIDENGDIKDSADDMNDDDDSGLDPDIA